MEKRTVTAGNQVSERVLAILDYMSAQSLPVRPQDAAKELNMPPATLLRHFGTLESEGYLYKNQDTQKYEMTFKICRWCHRMNETVGMRSIAGPHLNRLSHSTGMGSCLVVRQGHQSIYLDFVDNPHSMLGTLQRIGQQAPLYATGSGKILLSQFTPQELDAYFSHVPLQKLTEHTITDPVKIRIELAQVRERLYARDQEECEAAIHCISVPVYNYTDTIVAAISAFGNVAKTDTDYLLHTVLPQLREAATDVSLRMGCDRGYLEDCLAGRG